MFGRYLQLECSKSCKLLVPVLMYSSETMLWKKERSRIRAVQMNNLRGLLGILGGWIESQICMKKEVVQNEEGYR